MSGMQQHVVLDPEFHKPLLRAWPGIAERTGIARHWIKESMHDWCSDSAIEYMRRLNILMPEGRGGFVLSPKKVPVEDRCSVIAAACFRNYMDAKIFSLPDLLDRCKKEGVPDTTMVLVPDFFVYSNPLSPWQVSTILTFLSQRYLRRKATVLYVRNQDELAKAYGEEIATHLSERFTYEQ